MAKEITLWGIHAGRDGEAEPLFDKQKVIAIGWKHVGNLSHLKTRDDFKAAVAKTYPDKKPGAIPNNAGQLYRFVHKINVGDVVVFPLKRAPEIWLGVVKGEYRYDPKLEANHPNLRGVEWVKKYPRTKFSQGALYEVGSALTLFQVNNNAEEFLAALEGSDFQPVSDAEEEETIALVADDIERQSHDFVLKQISQKLKGHGLAEFVGHLLTLMGYKVIVSPPGPDRGIDIEAHKDDLGVEPPTILVQVKSSDAEENEAAVSQLYGKVAEKDFGIFIAVSGFKKNAHDFAFGKRNLKLIDGDELVELVYKYYDQLDGKYKGMIPLRRVFIPETLTQSA